MTRPSSRMGKLRGWEPATLLQPPFRCHFDAGQHPSTDVWWMCHREGSVTLASRLPGKQDSRIQHPPAPTPWRIHAHFCRGPGWCSNHPSNEQEHPRAGNICCDAPEAWTKERPRKRLGRGQRGTVFGFCCMCAISDNHVKSLLQNADRQCIFLTRLSWWLNEKNVSKGFCEWMLVILLEWRHSQSSSLWWGMLLSTALEYAVVRRSGLGHRKSRKVVFLEFPSAESRQRPNPFTSHSIFLAEHCDAGKQGSCCGLGMWTTFSFLMHCAKHRQNTHWHRRWGWWPGGVQNQSDACTLC